MDPVVRAVVAKYKEKLISEKGNPVYLYSERQVASRNRQKAERVEKLRNHISKLRTQVKEDLKSEDPKKKLTALAVALIDHTYERVGNDGSAENGHYGVTGWQKQHVTFGKGSATIKYVGKSGVKHEKKVTDASILKALRAAWESVESAKLGIFDADGAKVSSRDVNSYLETFKVTAKDLRGFHANREMQERLKVLRGKGGKLPEDKKAREKKLKDEFQEALEDTAEIVGHESATLRKQYLVSSIEEAYLKDGTVVEKLTKSAMDCQPDPPLLFANRIIRQLVDHMASSDLVIEEADFNNLRSVFRRCQGSWEKVLSGDPVHTELLKTIVSTWTQLPERKQDMERT